MNEFVLNVIVENEVIVFVTFTFAFALPIHTWINSVILCVTTCVCYAIP